MNNNARSQQCLSDTHHPGRYERLEVLSGTLEDEARFSGFKDMVDIIPLYRGRGDKAQLAGEFKVRILLHKDPAVHYRIFLPVCALIQISTHTGMKIL